MYAKIQADEVIDFPYDLAHLRRDFPGTSFPADLTGADLSAFGIMPVVAVAPPVTGAGEVADEQMPTLNHNVWKQTWAVRALNLEELVEAKAFKWGAAKVRRDRAIDAGVTVPGIGTFDSDAASRANVTGAVTMALIAGGAGKPFAISWKLADNTVTRLSGAQMIAAGVAVGEHVAAAHANAQTIGLSIQAAADFAALEAINLETGWPA